MNKNSTNLDNDPITTKLFVVVVVVVVVIEYVRVFIIIKFLLPVEPQNMI